MSYPIAPTALSLLLFCGYASIVVASDDQTEFFESRIRPVLIEHCYECHNSIDSSEGGLALDWRDGLIHGGSTGPSIVSRDPDQSLLMQMIRHEMEGQEMPSGGPKLSDAIIDDFEHWIRGGAFDPRDQIPTAESIAQSTSWEAKLARRKQWWSLQPIEESPSRGSIDHLLTDEAWSDHPVDRCLQATWDSKGLTPSLDADAATVLRRLHAILTGLPAGDQERLAFESAFAKDASSAVESKVDELLAMPAFGERWARHWMDWFRYSEGSGGQGDPRIENAFEYRDYLIRALNSDVPFDRLIREHLAGDLLPNPRIDADTGINESMIGLAHFRFVEHGYFPVDALDELVKFTDNQIDVITKAFLGLTVSCARCHDHKFDAISQRDYYALFGVFASSRPAHRPLLSQRAIDPHRETLHELRQSLAVSLKQQWLGEASHATIQQRLDDWSEQRKREQEAIDATPGSKVKQRRVLPSDLMFAWKQWQDEPNVSKAWTNHYDLIEKMREEATSHNASITERSWSFRDGLPEGWQVVDGTLRVHSAGELGLATESDKVVLSILPAGISTHSATTFEQASLTSPDLTIPNGAMAAHWAGAGSAMLRLVPENYPQPGGGLYKQVETANDGQPHWFGQESDFWQGRRGYFQLMTRLAATSRPPSAKAAGKNPAKDNRGSWFCLSEIRLLKEENDRVRNEIFSIDSLLSLKSPEDRDALVGAYVESIRDVLSRWQTDSFADQDALFLSACLEAGLLSHTQADLDKIGRIILKRIRDIEDALPAIHRSTPAVIDTVGFDQPLLTRGDHRKPEEPVRRGFIAALSSAEGPDIDDGSGNSNSYNRLHLAHDLTSNHNPLVRRVIANRLWQRVFGRGIVSTTDNFGATGDLPSHPELLDHLATRLSQEGWSIKGMLRYLLTSRSFRLSSEPTSHAQASDPNNRWRTHADVRRLDAEIIRDALLIVSGEIDGSMFGPSIPVSTPVEKDNRRGLYVAVDRSDKHELFTAFDVPFPTTTRGTRDVTTTPSQSITLLNAPFVWHQARAWSKRSLMENPSEDDRSRISGLIRVALTRDATDDELERLQLFLEESRRSRDDVEAFASVAHLVFNLKEFIYVR